MEIKQHKCFWLNQHGEKCPWNSLEPEKNYCKRHSIYEDIYSKEDITKLVKCSGCKNLYLPTNEYKQCDKCMERGKKNRLEQKNNKVLCKRENCHNEKSDENDYCGKHQKEHFKEETELLGKKVCVNYIRGCYAQLNKNDVFSRCLKCREKDRNRYLNNLESEKKRNQSYYMKNREVQRIKHRNTRHRITQEWFDAKMQEQDGKCAVCHQPFTETPHIDHNHECCPQLRSCDKCRRGLLCEDCNLGLGRFKDNPTVLANAIQYVNQYKKEQ